MCVIQGKKHENKIEHICIPICKMRMYDRRHRNQVHHVVSVLRFQS